MNKIRLKKIRKKALIFLILIIAIVVYLYTSSVNLILKAGGEGFQSAISNCSYFAVEQCIDEKFSFEKVCSVEKDNSGNITFIQTDTLLVNYLVKELALNCYEYLDASLDRGVNVPLGTFSGITLFSGFGPTVCVKLVHVLNVDCKILRTFESAGINQTRQTLSVIIHSDVFVHSLFKQKKYEGDIEVVLYDNLIMGSVPDFYLNTQTLASALKSGNG